MKQKASKIIKVFLFSMLLSLAFSMSVSAASKTVATIGKKKYTSLQKAVDSVKSGQTIKLTQNVTVSKTIQSKRNVKYTLDLAKHTIKEAKKNVTVSNDGSKVAGTFRVVKGNVTVTNGVFGTNAVIKVEKSGRLTIKSGTYFQIVNNGTTSIVNCKITQKKYSAILNTGGTLTINKATLAAKMNCINAVAGKVIIKNGTYKPVDSKSGYPTLYIGKATVSISNGTFKGVGSNVVYNEKGKLSITGGTFSSTGAYPTLYNVSGSIGISKGTVSAKDTNAIVSSSGKLTINGGTIKNASKRYCTIYCFINSQTVIKKGTVYNKYNEVISLYHVKKFILSGGTVKNTDASSCPIMVQDMTETPKNVSIKKACIVSPNKMKVNYVLG